MTHQNRLQSPSRPRRKPPSRPSSSMARPAPPASKFAAGWLALRGLRVQSIAAEKRKDEAERLAMMRQADLVVLCLPDEAAKEAVALIASLGSDAPKVVDASSAHRVADGWVYGFPEMDTGAGRRDQAGQARLQSGLLSDRGHRADPAAGGGRADAGRLSRHRQCGERLQRRRADHDRGLRRRERRRLSSSTASAWSTSTCRSCRSSPS